MNDVHVTREGKQLALAIAILFMLSILLSAGFHSLPPPPSGGEKDPATVDAEKRSLESFESLGGYFVENRGQVNDLVRYYYAGNPSVAFRDDGVMFVVRKAVGGQRTSPSSHPIDRFSTENEGTISTESLAYLIRFEGANEVSPKGIARLGFDSNFFLGNNPNGWRVGVGNFREVMYEGLYDGVDLVYAVTEEGVKYDFIVAPGTDVSVIRMSYEGVDGVELDTAGGLFVHTAIGDVVDSAPIAYQGSDDVDCSFVMHTPDSYGFACNEIDDSRGVLVDPLIYSTYLGGDGWDYGYSIAIDTAGNAYLTGITRSADFPVTPGAFDTIFSGSNDAFVAKLDSTGSSLLYSTYLGGGGDDRSYSIAIDSACNAYLTGHTNSSDFPVTPGAFDTTYNGLEESFVAKLDSTGGTLLYSTYLGGSDWDYGASIVVDSAGIAYTIGHTASTDFPVTPGAFDMTNSGFSDAFVMKLDASGSSLLYSTYLGGGYFDEGNSIAIDSAGNAYLTGYTSSSNFPVTPGAFDETFDIDDSFVTKLDPTGSSLVYSTYLGGTEWEYGYSITVDSTGNVYTTGETWSTDFPVTPGAFDTTAGSQFDAYLTKLDSSGSSLLYSTYIAGDGDDWGESVVIDSSGNAYLTGHTESTDFPVTPGAFDTTLNGSWDSFMAKMNSTGSSLIYSTFLGGGNNDSGISLRIDSAGDAFVIGYTESSDFPVSPFAFDTTFGGSPDAFVTKLPTVTSPPVADLAVNPSDISLFPSPPVIEGTTVRVNVTVHNLGGNYTESTAARFYDGIPPAPRIGTDQPLAPITAGGTANVTVFWNASPAGSHTICVVADPDNIVIEVDETNNMACVAADVLFSIKLDPGHRFMSFPLAVSNQNIDVVLSSISGCYDYVRWYNPLDSTDPWKSYMPARTQNDLTRLDNIIGFWIDVTASCDFTLSGTRLTSTSVNLRQGWNMIGFPSFNTTYTVGDLKAAIALAGIIVEAFDASAAPYYLQRVSDNFVMAAGSGYWVYVPSDATWTING